MDDRSNQRPVVFVSAVFMVAMVGLMMIAWALYPLAPRDIDKAEDPLCSDVSARRLRYALMVHRNLQPPDAATIKWLGKEYKGLDPERTTLHIGERLLCECKFCQQYYANNPPILQQFFGDEEE